MLCPQLKQSINNYVNEKFQLPGFYAYLMKYLVVFDLILEPGIECVLYSAVSKWNEPQIMPCTSIEVFKYSYRVVSVALSHWRACC